MKILWFFGNGSRVNAPLVVSIKNIVTVKASCSIALNGRNCTAAAACHGQVYLCGSDMGKGRDTHVNQFGKSSNG